MYILLLWWRYLRRRYLAYNCIICVMLGVATLIVVNSVMGGFSKKLKERLHANQSDLVMESLDPITGFPLPADEIIRRIKESPAGPHIEAIAPSVEIFAILQFNYRGYNAPQKVKLIGIDPKHQKEVGGFAEYLLDEKHRERPSFDLSPELMKLYEEKHPPLREPIFPPAPVKPAPDIIRLPPIEPPTQPDDPKPPRKEAEMEPTPVQPKNFRGIIVGHALASFRNPATGKTVYTMELGDSVRILTLGSQLDPVIDDFIVCDYFKSEMAEYDSSAVYVPLDYLQQLRVMDNRVNTIQIRLKHYDTRHAEAIRDSLRQIFPSHTYAISTWEDKQGVILSAIRIERGILNILLFMIIGVAGFGILAIFSMIVTEKTRDIGILKSLGASNSGVRRIFLGYGLLIGLVGGLMGTILGLLIADNINDIERFIAKVRGSKVFPEGIYYFDKIPTDVQIDDVALVNFGAILIAILFSILPAFKAARVQPVQALRYE